MDKIIGISLKDIQLRMSFLCCIPITFKEKLLTKKYIFGLGVEMMELVVFLFICWFTSAILVTHTKHLSHQEIAFLILYTILINTNAYVLLTDNFKLIALANDKIKFISFLLYRSVAIPVLISVLISLYYTRKSTIQKIGIIAFSLILFFLLEKLSHYFGLITYKNWNAWITVLYLAILSITAMGFLKLFQRTCTGK